MDEWISPDLASTLRDQAFDEMERVAGLAESYSRSLGEAAHRGDELTTVVHVKELRLCCLGLIDVYNNFLLKK